MDIPIYIDGKKQGILTIEREGPVTVMTADMADVGRVVRLTVYGERSGYLGVPEPVEGRLRLTRRLSPAQMRSFPRTPEYAAEGPMEGQKTPPQAPSAPKEAEQGEHVLWMGGKPHYF